MYQENISVRRQRTERWVWICIFSSLWFIIFRLHCCCFPPLSHEINTHQLFSTSNKPREKSHQRNRKLESKKKVRPSDGVWVRHNSRLQVAEREFHQESWLILSVRPKFRIFFNVTPDSWLCLLPVQFVCPAFQSPKSTNCPSLSCSLWQVSST